MIEIINHSTDPCFNMALEEYLIKDLDTDEDVFMLWQNRPAVVVGRNQNTTEEINPAFIEQQGITVVRRLSGGGAVYHDQGNLNFTFILNNGHDFSNFEKFTRPVIDTLARLGIKAENAGRNDITIQGRKFSGNAQYKHHQRLLHHGTLLFGSDIESMVQALNPSGAKITSKGIKSVRSRVANIGEYLSAPMSLPEFRQVLTQEVLGQDYGRVRILSAGEFDQVRKLRDDKHASWDWVYGSSPPFNLRRTASFSWGNIDVRLDVKRGLIRACRIYGDYFAQRDMTELEGQLAGILYRRAEVRACLAVVGLQEYLPQMSDEEMIDLLFV
ncbi:MAG: lipoate--protein ligase [Syntrophomonadaceae bacterium]